MAFTAMNLVYVPVAYASHLLSLINTLTDSDETMDEFDEKFRRFKTIIWFFLLGPLAVLASVPIDSFVYCYNLYTKPKDADDKEDLELISKRALDIFSVAITESLQEHRKATGKMGDTKMPFVDINKKLQEKLDIL